MRRHEPYRGESTGGNHHADRIIENDDSVSPVQHLRQGAGEEILARRRGVRCLATGGVSPSFFRNKMPVKKSGRELVYICSSKMISQKTVSRLNAL